MSNKSYANNILSSDQESDIIGTLALRFADNVGRHETMVWDDVEARLKEKPGKLWSLFQMEETGGEPDVVGYDDTTGEYLFFDCSAQTPKGRRSICYDGEALRLRKEHKPATSAMDMAELFGIELLTESEYRYLQQLGTFDTKTSSWVKTPEEIRMHGGALFCDRRYNTVFVYHNGAESYYGVRGFRGVCRV